MPEKVMNNAGMNSTKVVNSVGILSDNATMNDLLSE